MQSADVIASIGEFCSDAVLVAHALPSDGAVLRIVWCNPAFSAISGFTLDDVRERTPRLLFGPDTDVDRHLEIIEQLTNWKSFTSDILCYHKRGTPFWGEFSFRPVADEEGKFRYWLCFIRDVTAQKRTEELGSDLSLIAETTRDMVSLLDSTGQVTWVNRSFEQTSGHALIAAQGRSLVEILASSQSEPGDVDTLRQAFERGEEAQVQLLCRRQDDTNYWAEIEVQPIRDHNGQVLKFLSTQRDVTERKSLEDLHNAIFDETNSAIFVKEKGKYIFVNQRFADAFGHPRAWFVQRTDRDLMADDSAERAAQRDMAVLSTGESIEQEIEVTLPDGRTQTHLEKRFRVYDRLRDTYLLCGVSTDISDIRDAQRAVEDARLEAEQAEQRLWGAVNAITDGFVLFDAEDRIVQFNEAFSKMHGALGVHLQKGQTFEEAVRIGLEKGIWDLGDMSPEEWVAHQVEQRIATRGQEHVVKFSEDRWMLRKEIALPSGEVVGLRIDLTEVKRNEAALQRAQEEAQQAQDRLVAAIEALDDAFVLFDNDDKLVLSNQKYRELHGPIADEVTEGADFEDILRAGADAGLFNYDTGDQADWIARRLDLHSAPSGSSEWQLSNGRYLTVSDRQTPTGDTVGLHVDITNMKRQQKRLQNAARDLASAKTLAEERNLELEAAKEQIEYDALHDALTGLPNRQYLDRELRRRAEMGVLGVLQIDLDRFKQINDTLGHRTGDQLLRHAAGILTDCAGAEHFVARVGGDEFVILARIDTDDQMLETLAARIIKKMRKPFIYQGHECWFGCSVGIAVTGDVPDDAEQAFINADIALYKAKGDGRSRAAVFTTALQTEIKETKELADALLQALEDRDLIAFYQPQFDAQTLDIVGAEALVRWPHKTRGLLTPDKFLQVAEDLNVVAAIDQMVLQHAAEQREIWRSAGIDIPHVSVNVSGRRLLEAELIKDIKALNFEPGSLSIELLESIFLDDRNDAANWRIDELKELGHSVELDDFGTGHASILSLVRLGPHRMKIDRQFIMPISENVERAALVASMIDMGRSLGVEVVAEGVETHEHAAILREMGCDVLQGYGFARPMAGAEIVDFVRADAWRASA